MITDLDNTETVVRRHLKAFLDQRGIAAIVNDYADDACFLTEERTYRGKRAIGTFFEAFIAALPPQAIGRFALRTLRAEGEMAYITWSAGAELPLGTDTFIVHNGRIVLQTFAIYAAPAGERTSP